MKIKGIPVATPVPRPDWNQDDPSKADYIKNKPTTDTTLSKSGMAADAKVAGGRIRGLEENVKGLQTGKVPIGLYSRDTFWVDSQTAKFWDHVIAIYDDMAVGTVELVNGIVVSSFSSVDPNEPAGGNYRVTITKSRDANWGFVEAESYHPDAWGGPNRITRLKRDGKWLNAVDVSANIYEHVRREVLWENASPTSALTSTLISLNNTATKYNALLILVNMDTNLHYTIPVLIKYGGSSNGGVAYFPVGSTVFHASDGQNSWSAQWRYFWWQGSKLKVKMDNLKGSKDTFGPSNCVPLRVYGLNL